MSDTFSIILDERIEADSLEELRAKAADMAEAEWRREQQWRGEMAARPPKEHDPIASAEAMRLWEARLVEEVTSKSPLFG